MHEVLVNRLGGLSQPRKRVVRLIDRPDMTLDVYRGRKTRTQQQQYFSIDRQREGRQNDMAKLLYLKVYPVAIRVRAFATSGALLTVSDVRAQLFKASLA